MTKSALEQLKEEYFEEFRFEIGDLDRPVSVRDVEDYFGVPIVIAKLNGEQYSLLKKL